MELNHLFRIVIGDWSGDGHKQSDEFYVTSNYPVKDLQDAYKASCKLTGLSFNHNDNFTGIKEDWRESKKRLICAEYMEPEIGEYAREVLAKHGLTMDKYFVIEDDEEDEEEFYFEPRDFSSLIMDFIGLSMPKDFKYEIPKEDVKPPVLNGWWDKNLNVQFGYGLYD